MAKQSVSATATDNAGNTASANLKLNIDKTPPTITATASLAPNAKGWNNSNVTVTGVSEVDQINRGQSRSNQAFGSQPNARKLADEAGASPYQKLSWRVISKESHVRFCRATAQTPT